MNKNNEKFKYKSCKDTKKGLCTAGMEHKTLKGAKSKEYRIYDIRYRAS